MNSKNIDAVAVRDRVAKLEPLEQGLYAEGFNNCKTIVRRIVADAIRARASTVAKDGGEATKVAMLRAALIEAAKSMPEHWSLLQSIRHTLTVTADDSAYPKPEASAATPQAGEVCWSTVALAVDEAERRSLDYVSIRILRGILERTRLAAPTDEDTEPDENTLRLAQEAIEALAKRSPMSKEQIKVWAEKLASSPTGTNDAEIREALASPSGSDGELPPLPSGHARNDGIWYSAADMYAYVLADRAARLSCQTEPAKGEARVLRDADGEMIGIARRSCVPATQSPAQVNAESDSIEDERANFEDWYVTHIDGAKIGSADCAARWSAWVAGSSGCYKAPGGWKIAPMPWSAPAESDSQSEVASHNALIAADGWQLVPVIPDIAMLDAGMATRKRSSATSLDIWLAMLAAAPSVAPVEAMTKGGA